MTAPDVLPVIAGRFGAGIVDALQREYPNAPRHVMRDAADTPTPSGAHPAFYGCFDWHSAVEMTWALVRLLREVPSWPAAGAARAHLQAHLTADRLAVEARYLRENAGYERPYGWGWALALAEELAEWAATDTAAAEWSAAVEPLARAVEDGFVTWLPKPAYPDRTGMHSNTAFALARALPWARRGDGRLLEAVERAAHRWYWADADYTARFEPSGADFLSPALTEMVLMREVLDDARWAEWVARFDTGDLLDELAEPALVTDDQDGQGAHLHGLNLYRMHALAELISFERDVARKDRLYEARANHVEPAMQALLATGWMAEHWLAAYGVLAFGRL